MKHWKLLDVRERVAFLAAAAMILTTIGYWVVQIYGVIATLKLAYG